MGQTPNYKWPTPEGGDKPAGMTQIKALGDAADADLKKVETKVDNNQKNALPFGMYKQAKDATGINPHNAWIAQPLDTAVYDDPKWFNPTAKVVRVPPGVYEVKTHLIIKIGAGVVWHVHRIAAFISKPATPNAVYAAIGEQVTNYYGEYAEYGVCTSGLLVAHETLDVRPGCNAIPNGRPVDESMWPGSYLTVTRLRDAPTTTSKDYPPTSPRGHIPPP